MNSDSILGFRFEDAADTKEWIEILGSDPEDTTNVKKWLRCREINDVDIESMCIISGVSETCRDTCDQCK